MKEGPGCSYGKMDNGNPNKTTNVLKNKIDHHKSQTKHCHFIQ